MRKRLLLEVKSQPKYLLENYSWWKTNNEKKYELTQVKLLKAEILIQDELNIYELPIVIEKIHDFESLLRVKKDISCGKISKKNKSESN